MDVRTAATIACILAAAAATAALAALTSPTDRAALVAVAAANPSFNVSGSWVGDPCGGAWIGVSCEASSVTDLVLDDKFLTGAIPPELGGLAGLQTLSLTFNALTGAIPKELGELATLRSLLLYNNALTGEIPAALGALVNLRSLHLTHNNFTGKIPPALGNLTGLADLHISYSSALTGTIPPELGGLASLVYLALSGNGLTGAIPPELGGLAGLQTLSLDNNGLTGTIPPALAELADLQTLDLQDNFLNGTVPLFSLTVNKNVRNNCFTGTTEAAGERCVKHYDAPLTSPADRAALVDVAAANPSFNVSGSWTGDPCGDKWRGVTCDNSSRVTSLALSSNALTGTIPPELGGLASLTSLSLFSNNLTGAVPPELGGLASLTSLFLFSNNLTGAIPTELGGLASLTSLDLFSNNLTGAIPPELGRLASLTSLDLSSNALTGAIPPELGGLASLWHLRLHSNALTGPIPPELGGLASLTTLYLGYNNLTGEIPPELGGLASLQTLSLSSNALTGAIPPSLRNLSNCSVTVTRNYLIGAVPDFATSWDYSLNCLSRTDGQRSASSCAPYSLPSPPPPGTGVKVNRAGLIVGMTVGVAFVVVALGLAVWLWARRKGRSTSMTIEDTMVKKWDLAEVLVATNNFDEGHRIGSGGFASVYKATFKDETLAVKRISNQSREARGSDDFIKEVTTIGNIHNRNLLGLRGYCIEGEEWLLMYDYMANGSLQDRLFGEAIGDPLDWSQRVSILVGTANAIAYLHEGCKEKIIHRDIKPANILLDEHLVPHVADFGLARSALIADTHVSTRVAGTFGYLAPEYAKTGQLTEKSDVFSFGVLILVVIGRRPAIDTSGRDQFVGITDWAYTAAAEDRLLDLVSPPLSDACDQEQARKLISMSLLCTQPTWQARPNMGHVVQMLNGNIAVPTVDFGALGALVQQRVTTAQVDWSTSQDASSRMSDSGLSGNLDLLEGR